VCGPRLGGAGTVRVGWDQPRDDGFEEIGFGGRQVFERLACGHRPAVVREAVSRTFLESRIARLKGSRTIALRASGSSAIHRHGGCADNRRALQQITTRDECHGAFRS
jgi:hypothetical protein